MATSPATDFRTTPAMPLDGILLAEELLDLAERAQAYTSATGVAIALRRGRDLLVRTSTGAAPEVGSVIPDDDLFLAECLQRRKPLCCRDTDADARVGPLFRALKTRSLIAVPIGGQPDNTRGVMVVIAPLPNAFQPTHTAILMTLSDIISSKLAAREVSEVVLEIVGEPPPVLSATSERTKQAPLATMPVIAPTPMDVPPSIEAAPIPLQSAPVAEAAPNAAPHVPPALLKDEPLRLVEEKKTGPDPALLNPAEDPLRFKRQTEEVAPASSARLEPLTIVAKPVAPVVIKSIAPPAPVARFVAAPSLSTWETHHEPSAMQRFLVPAVAVAAVLVVAATLWMYRSTGTDTAPPTIPVPSAVAVAMPPAAPVETPAPLVAKNPPQNEVVAKSEPAAKAAPEQHPAAKAERAAEVKREPAPQPVIEIAAAQPKPKPEPEPEMPAPKLLPAGNDSAVASLSRVHVEVPMPPKSHLVAATLVSRVAPEYPSMARQLGIYGKVVMNITIGADGSVTAVRFTEGALQLRAAAADAVRQWRYTPATLNGKAVESSAQVQVNFTR